MDYMPDVLTVMGMVMTQDNTWLERFSSLKTDEERIKVTLTTLRRVNILPQTLNVTYEEKSSSRSTEFKDEGNKLYSNPESGMKLDLVIENYSKSVAYAPPESRELSLAYANRSAALFTARLFNDCLQDIDRALGLNYPEKLKAKLFTRKARCLMILNQSASSPETKKALEEARLWLEKMDLNDPGRKAVERILNDPKLMITNEKPRMILDDERNLVDMPNDNPEFPGASSAIEIRYSEKFGRHIVATRDIKPGKILVVEQAYASNVDGKRRYDHCGNCMKQTWSGIPCDHCVEVIYCSAVCRNAAWIDHHDVECQVLGPLIALETSEAGLMALRLVVRAVKEAGSLQALKDQLSAIDSSSDLRTQGFTGNVFDNKKYASVYTLARNTEKRSGIELFGKSRTSIYVLYMLATRSNIFGAKFEGDLDDLEKNEWMMFIGGLILRHLQITGCNPSEVHEISVGTGRRLRGVAIAPFNCLFNHSCNVMTSGSWIGRYYVKITAQFIKKGEQIFDTYEPIYFMMPKMERQEQLKKQYDFECECIACRENWPVLNDLPSFWELGLSKTLVSKLRDAMKIAEKYQNRAIVGDVEDKPEEIIKGISSVMKVFKKHVHHPCYETASLWTIFNKVFLLQGNRWQSLD